MVDQNKNLNDAGPEETGFSKREVSADEQKIEFEKEGTVPVPERKENLVEEKLVSEKLKKELEMMDLDENLKAEAEKKAKKIEFLGEKEKIEHLLKIAHEKGVAFAVQTAKRMNDAYLLDIFHDVLAREGYYKQIIKK